MMLSDSFRSIGRRRRNAGGSHRGAVVAAVGVIMATTTLLSACSSAPKPVSSAEAVKSYPVVLSDLESALRSAYSGVAWEESKTNAPTVDPGDDNGCLLTLPALRSDSSLWAAAGGWKEVMDVVNPVLDEHDFATVSSEDSIDGGWTGISSSDDHDAEIRFVDKDFTEITLSVPVSGGDCSAQE